MSNELIVEWLDETIRREGLDGGLRALHAWASDLNRLERELLRVALFAIVHRHLEMGYVGERRDTAYRLVEAALHLCN